MKKGFKRVLAMMMSVAMLLSMLPANEALATGESNETQTNVAQIGEVKYATLNQAIEAAEDGDKIIIINDISLTAADSPEGQSTYFKIEGKSITVDLNGKNISANTTDLKVELYGVFAVDNKGELVLEDSSDREGKVELIAGGANIKALIVNYSQDSKVAINGGSYIVDVLPNGNGMIYSYGDNNIIINDGNYYLGNLGTLSNGSPWIFNGKGQQINTIIVNGGTFNADVNHQKWMFEVKVPENRALKKIDDKTWTVVEAEAYVDEWEETDTWYLRKIGYATIEEAEASAEKKLENAKTATGDNTLTAEDIIHEITYVASIDDAEYISLQEAIDAAKDGEVVKLLTDISLTEEDAVKTTDDKFKVLVKIEGKDITLDMNDKSIFVEHEEEYNDDFIAAVIYVEEDTKLTVIGNGKIDINANDESPNIVYMFWKRGEKGALTIENGVYHANNLDDAMVYTNGSEIVTVKGGTFTLDKTGTGPDGNGSPWIFNTKGQNERKIIVTGGTYNANVLDQYWKYEVQVPEDS